MEEYRDTVAFAMSTWRMVKEFQTRLRELEKRLPMPEVRDYLASGVREEYVPGDIYDEIDALKELRAKGIRQEMKYADAQARSAGLTLSEPVRQGYDLMAMPPLEVLKQVPSLGIYRQFMWVGDREGDNEPPTP